MILRALAGLLLASLLAESVEACSCALLQGTPEEQVQQSFDQAETVFVARVLRTTLKPDLNAHSMVFEDASFEVVEVFKGDLRVGQVVRVYQVVSAGSCGQSSTNNPPWMYRVAPKGGETTPARLSKKWLVYSRGQGSFELSQCTRSSPLNVGGDEDVKMLRHLVKKASRKR